VDDLRRAPDGAHIAEGEKAEGTRPLSEVERALEFDHSGGSFPRFRNEVDDRGIVKLGTREPCRVRLIAAADPDTITYPEHLGRHGWPLRLEPEGS
jgi:hypothetical protein